MEFDDIELVDLADHDDDQLNPSITLRLSDAVPMKWEMLFREKIRGRSSTGRDGTITLTDIDLGARFGVTVTGRLLEIQGVELGYIQKYGLKRTLKKAVAEANEAYRAQAILDGEVEDQRREAEEEVQRQRREERRRAWDDDDSD